MTTPSTFYYSDSTSSTSYETELTQGSYDRNKVLIGVDIGNAVTSLKSLQDPNTRLTNGCFYNCVELQSITIPSNITSIGEYCFCSCVKLATVNIPPNIGYLDNAIFLGCSSLTSIDIPSNIKTLGGDVFNSSGLISINIPDSITGVGNACFANCPNLINIEHISSAMTRFPAEYCFRGCTKLTSIHIPSNITDLGRNGTFEGCRSLQSVTIPNDITVIPGSFLGGCSSLTSINIPDKVVLIGQYSFAGCTSLASIVIPMNVYWMDSRCFLNCDNLKTVTYDNPAAIVNIGDAIFTNTPPMTVNFYNTSYPPVDTKGTVYNTNLYTRCSKFHYYGPYVPPTVITNSVELSSFLNDKTSTNGILADSIAVDYDLMSSVDKVLFIDNSNTKLTKNIVN